MDPGPIDFHTHTHPTAELGLAFQRRWGFIDSPRTGTVDELFGIMDRCGVRRTLIVPWMPAQDHAVEIAAQRYGASPTAGQRAEVHAEVVRRMIELNQWAVDQVAAAPDRLSCIVGLDPIMMDEATLKAEVGNKLAKGAVGLKIAPMFLRVPANDDAMAIVYQQAREHGVFVLSQAGADGYRGAPAWGHPQHFDDVLAAYPTVDVMLAHLGMGAEEDVARLTAKHPNLYADCSSRLHLFGQPGQWTLSEAGDWFRRIGIDRVVFGTNYPLNDPVEYVEVIHAMPLTEEERRKVFFENAQGIMERSVAHARR